MMILRILNPTYVSVRSEIPKASLLESDQAKETGALVLGILQTSRFRLDPSNRMLE
jgi:hypothetical protein